jgi:hypothetical protein
MNAVSKRLAGTRKRIAAQFTALDKEHLAVLLARLADRLTLMARETYLPGDGVADSARLRTFNEAQNRIAAPLVRLLTADQGRYPDDVFANVLVDQFQILGVDPERIIAGCLDLSSTPEPETAMIPAHR